MLSERRVLLNRLGAAQELNRLAISLAIMYSLQCLGVHRIERPISLCYLQLFCEDNCREFEALQPGSVLAPRFKVTKLETKSLSIQFRANIELDMYCKYQRLVFSRHGVLPADRMNEAPKVQMPR